MKKTKMSLENMQGKLTRSEMKNIMAGDAPAAYCGQSCFNNDDCQQSSICKTCTGSRKCF